MGEFEGVLAAQVLIKVRQGWESERTSERKRERARASESESESGSGEYGVESKNKSIGRSSRRRSIGQH
jgi:hypothetical protein